MGSQIASVDEFVDDKAQSVGSVTDVMHWNDVRVFEGSDYARFLEIRFDSSQKLDEFVTRQLDGNVAAEVVVAGLVNDAESAGPQHGSDPIPSQEGRSSRGD